MEKYSVYNEFITRLKEIRKASAVGTAPHGYAAFDLLCYDEYHRPSS